MWEALLESAISECGAVRGGRAVIAIGRQRPDNSALASLQGWVPLCHCCSLSFPFIRHEHSTVPSRGAHRYPQFHQHWHRGSRARKITGMCVYVARDSAATWSVPHVIVSSRPFFPRRHSCSRPCRCTLKELRFPPLRCSPHIITALVSQRIHRPHEHTSMRATEGVDGGAAALRVLRVHDSGAGSSSGRRTRIIIGVKAKPLLDVARWIRT